MKASTQHLGNNLFTGLMNCFAYSWIVGISISLTLMAIVFMSANAQAARVDDEVALPRVNRLSDIQSGQLVFHTPQGQYLTSPTVDTNVEIDVSALLARVRVSQTFTNPTSQWQEGIYVFPLVETAAVDHLRMKIGERVIEGEIQPRQQARKTYDTAKSLGKRASLIEQQRPNLFTSSVANIAPGDSITVIIEYQQMVNQNDEEFSLRFPMVVAPRYIPGKAVINTAEISHFNANGWAVNTDQVPDASHITPPVITTDQRVNPINLQVNLAAGFPLAMIESRHHQIEKVTLDDGSWKIRLIDIEPANRDFELVWQAELTQSPQAALFRQQHKNQDYALLMLTPPQQFHNQSIARELIFVIDTSGSMDGTSIKQARAALQYGLEQLRPQDSFNIIRFSDDTESLFEQARLATGHNLDIARDFVNWLRAEGGTEMAPALSKALKSRPALNSLRQIVFLTDGSVGNEDELFCINQTELGR